MPFDEREGKEESMRETCMQERTLIGCLPCVPWPVIEPAPYVPLTGIKPENSYVDGVPTNWAIPARAC